MAELCYVNFELHIFETQSETTGFFYYKNINKKEKNKNENIIQRK